MDEKIIYNYLQKKTSPQEECALLDWINQSPDNKALFFEIKTHWNLNRNTISEKELIASLARLNKKINQKESRAKKINHQIYIWSSVAAIAMLTILSYIIYPQVTGKENGLIVYTNYADTVKVIKLADGTTVWLRKNTVLTCQSSFAKHTREVLLAGEAFFDVPKGTLPFIVKTEVNFIKVIGTSFSVNTHLEGFIETILMTGTIQLQQIGENSVTILHPGQSALYSIDCKSLEISDVAPNMYTSWRYGVISLSNVSIHTILQCVEDTYNVKLKMNATSLKDHSYNFSFKCSNVVGEVLSQLTLITGVPVGLD